MIVASNNSTLNRLVVGSIPTASTTLSLKINDLQTIKCARKEQRPSHIVVFVVDYCPALVILWTYLPESCTELRFTHQQIVVINLASSEMNSPGPELSNLYLLSASLRMEQDHGPSHPRTHIWRSHGRCCPRNVLEELSRRPLHHNRRPEYHSSMPTQHASLRFEQGQIGSGPSVGGSTCN